MLSLGPFSLSRPRINSCCSCCAFSSRSEIFFEPETPFPPRHLRSFPAWSHLAAPPEEVQSDRIRSACVFSSLWVIDPRTLRRDPTGMANIVLGWAFSSRLFFVEKESFETELRDLFHQAPSFLVIGNPLTDRLLHGLRDMDHLSLSGHPESQVKAGMKLAPGALAAGFSAGSLHRDEAAEDKGFFVKDLGEAGASPPFRIGKWLRGAHEGLPPFILIYYNISD